MHPLTLELNQDYETGLSHIIRSWTRRRTNPNLPNPVRKTVKFSPQRSKRPKRKKPCTAKTCVGMSHSLRSGTNGIADKAPSFDKDRCSTRRLPTPSLTHRSKKRCIRVHGKKRMKQKASLRKIWNLVPIATQWNPEPNFWSTSDCIRHQSWCASRCIVRSSH